MTTIRKLLTIDFQTITNAFTEIGWNKPVELFEKYFQEESQGLRFCFIAFHDDIFSGYCTLVKESGYEYGNIGKIPEISDLNVLPDFRNKGIGALLIQKCEEVAKEFSNKIGLGVGLTTDYANAFNLYLKLGYKLDGNGIAYNGKTLKYGESTVVDDALNLYLTKNLS